MTESAPPRAHAPSEPPGTRAPIAPGPGDGVVSRAAAPHDQPVDQRPAAPERSVPPPATGGALLGDAPRRDVEATFWTGSGS